MDIFTWLTIAQSKKASDLHLSAGNPPLIRVNGNLARIDNFGPLAGEEVKGSLHADSLP